jgi:hypothetical protein
MLKSSETISQKIVRQALSFKMPDRLPVFESYWDEFIDMWRKANPGINADIEDHYGIDLAIIVAREELFPLRMREIKRDGPDVYKDDGWGRIIRTRPGTYFMEPVERLLNKPSDLDKLHFDSPSLEFRYSNLPREAAANRAKGRAVFVKIGGPFIRTSFLRGETEFLMDLACDETFARRMVERVGEHLLQVGLESLKAADARDFGIWIYDDMANINSPMFSPRTFERIFLPVYKRIVSELKAAGARWVILHSDGNIGPVLDLLVEAGINGINPVEASAGLDVVELMKKYYGRLAFIGGVCNTHVLPGNDNEQIRRHVEAIIDAGRNGGLVIGTHSIGPDITPQSYDFYRGLVARKGTFLKQ